MNRFEVDHEVCGLNENKASVLRYDSKSPSSTVF